MSEPSAPQVARLEAAVESLQAEVEALTESLSVLAAATEAAGLAAVVDVEAEVSGPRMSLVAVELNDVPMKGQYDRKGKRRGVVLTPPEVNVNLAAKGASGTKGTLTVRINGKEKKETFTLKGEYFTKAYAYPVKDFVPAISS